MKFFTPFGTVLLSLVTINNSHASSSSMEDFTNSSESARFGINKLSAYPRAERNFICREYDETFQLIRKTKYELEKFDCTNLSKIFLNNPDSSKESTSNTNICSELRDQHLKQYKKLVYLTYIRRHFYGN